MSNIEPTEEQKQAAQAFADGHGLWVPSALARLLAEREAKLRAELSEANAEINALRKSMMQADACIENFIANEDKADALLKRAGLDDTVNVVPRLAALVDEVVARRARVADLEAFTLLTDGQRTAEMFAADLAVVTRAVREADQLHQTVGGGTRHYVNECLLPCLKDEGLAIIVVGKAHYDDAKAAEGGEG